MRADSLPSLRAAIAAAFLALAAGCQTPPPTPVAWKLPDGVKTLDVNGYPMAYLERGRGPTVILVHGVMCDLRCWGTLMTALSAHYHVVSVSLRHYYPEPWDGSGEYSVAQHASDLAAFVQKMSPPVRMVTHSYGGSVAFEMLRKNPGLVSKLVLAEGSTDGLLPPPAPAYIEARAKFAVATEEMMKTRGADAMLEFGVDLLYGKGTFARYSPQVQMAHRDNAWTLVAGAKGPIAQLGACADFGSLQMPVLLATGENTIPRFKHLVPLQQQCLPSAKKVVVPNAAHAFIGEPSFVAAVEDFLR